MVEITLKNRHKMGFPVYDKDGKLVEMIEFEKGVPKYFHENSLVAKRILSSKQSGVFEVNEEIKALKVSEGWENLPPQVLRGTLSSLGVDTKDKTKQAELVKLMEKEIKSGTITIVKPEKDSPNTGNVKILLEQNAELKNRVTELEKQFEAQKKAFEEALAKVIKDSGAKK